MKGFCSLQSLRAQTSLMTTMSIVCQLKKTLGQCEHPFCLVTVYIYAPNFPCKQCLRFSQCVLAQDAGGISGNLCLGLRLLGTSSLGFFSTSSGAPTPTLHFQAPCGQFWWPCQPSLGQLWLWRLRSRPVAPLVSFSPLKTGRSLDRLWKGFGIHKIPRQVLSHSQNSTR